MTSISSTPGLNDFLKSTRTPKLTEAVTLPRSTKATDVFGHTFSENNQNNCANDNTRELSSLGGHYSKTYGRVMFCKKKDSEGSLNVYTGRVMFKKEST